MGKLIYFLYRNLIINGSCINVYILYVSFEAARAFLLKHLQKVLLRLFFKYILFTYMIKMRVKNILFLKKIIQIKIS